MYTNPSGVKIAFAELAGLTPSQIFFTNFPFLLSVPPGVDWDGEPWEWYRQEYQLPAKAPPSPGEVANWTPHVPPYRETPPAVEVIDHAAEVESAISAAKSARTVASTIEITERLAARVAELEKRLGL